MTPTPLQFYTLDAFTKTKFAGNAAAVFVLPQAEVIPDEICQKIANEFNLAETAFTKFESVDADGVPTYSLRFWTPT
jgi:PhzF family phenazine biosynthesis protein